MISYLNIKQLEALAEIPKSLVVDCDGKPDATIYFTKVNQSAVSYYDIVRHLNELTAPPIAPTIPITKTNTVSCSATKTCAAYKPVPQSPAKP